MTTAPHCGPDKFAGSPSRIAWVNLRRSHSQAAAKTSKETMNTMVAVYTYGTPSRYPQTFQQSSLLWPVSRQIRSA